MYDVLIIGGGTAGITAGIYAKRSGLSVLIIENNVAGGQILNTPEIENFPAIVKINGFDFTMNLLEQVKVHEIDMVYKSPISYDLLGDIKKVTTKDGEYLAKTIIIANGVTRRELECDGEQKFKGKGVSYCATCDGAFFKNSDVCIVGGGNTALEDALFLSNNCSTVYLIYRGEKFRGSAVLAKAVAEKSNIKILYNTQISSINGETKVSSITTTNNEQINVCGVFVAIGLKSNNDIFKDVLNLDNQGYIIAGEDSITNIDGVFCAGDTRTKILRQLVTAASDGAISAYQASVYIEKSNLKL